jgi:hypothetical protein
MCHNRNTVRTGQPSFGTGTGPYYGLHVYGSYDYGAEPKSPELLRATRAASIPTQNVSRRQIYIWRVRIISRDGNVLTKL